jgi:hypothetical protein
MFLRLTQSPPCPEPRRGRPDPRRRSVPPKPARAPWQLARPHRRSAPPQPSCALPCAMAVGSHTARGHGCAAGRGSALARVRRRYPAGVRPLRARGRDSGPSTRTNSTSAGSGCVCQRRLVGRRSLGRGRRCGCTARTGGRCIFISPPSSPLHLCGKRLRPWMFAKAEISVHQISDDEDRVR